MVCVLMKEAGYRDAVATLQRLSEDCCWFRTEEHVDEFVKQCLHYMDDLFVGASGPLGDDGLDKDGGYSYTLVMMDDMSNLVWLEPTGACMARLTAQHLFGLVRDHWGSRGVGE